MATKFNIARDDTYGAIIRATNVAGIDLRAQADALLRALIQAGKITAPYVEVDRKHRGSALNYDLYDIETSRGKVTRALYQQRETTCTKYGNSPIKDYLLITKSRKKVPEFCWLDHEEKIRVVKLAKRAVEPGEVIDVVGRVKMAA